MIARHDLTPICVIRSLRSRTCPACGGVKALGKTLCLTDYRKLPAAMRDALYLRVGRGYEEALTDAFQFLQVKTFHE